MLVRTPARHALAQLGLDQGWVDTYSRTGPERLHALAAAAGAPPEPARVTRTDRGACDLVGGDGPMRATWGADVVAAVARDPQAVPSTGDWVVVQRWPDGHRTVEVVLPRRTAVVRAQVGGTSSGQVLAANAAVVAVVEALHPDPDLGRVERLMALAWESGAQPRLVLTKSDLSADGRVLAEEVAAEVGGGCPVDVTAAYLAVGDADGAQGDGLHELRAVLAGGATIALLGASGVGKSTLLNALVGGAEVMRTQALGAVHKGRHTTVTRELHVVPGGGCVIDTPGLRSVGLVGEEGLAEVFADVDELAADCRFGDCGHGVEPGCAVRAAVESGDLAQRRLDSWDKLRREATWQASRVDARLRQEQLRVWKQRTKANRQRPARS
ncbi:MAG TPA: ribosome small subunit-dependent GTPase A [Actinomycetales bacterium]|jgi:ribosome biogenesis GTPase